MSSFDEYILSIQGLILRFYTYEGIVEALDGVNLNIKPAEILGLVGETGCGKSVTSLSILNLVPPPGRIEGGEITLREGEKTINILEQHEDFLRKIRGNLISMIFQEPRAYLNPVFTVEEQLGEVLVQHRLGELLNSTIQKIDMELEKADKPKRHLLMLHKKLCLKMLKNPRSLSVRVASKIPLVNGFKSKLRMEIRKKVVELLKDMEIPDPQRVARMYPHELSGGMAQRVVIAMALACNPKLLIADEPTTNLDVTVQAQILHLIRVLREKYKSSILYITHDLGVVAELCDRVAVMYAGNVVELADVYEIFKNPLHPYTRALLESIPRPGKEFKSIPGTVPSLINPPSGCRFHDRCQFAMEICNKVKPKFIEVGKDHYVACHLFGGGK
jgi:peptide/nickel transport system ATP-binding protein